MFTRCRTNEQQPLNHIPNPEIRHLWTRPGAELAPRADLRILNGGSIDLPGIFQCRHREVVSRLHWVGDS